MHMMHSVQPATDGSDVQSALKADKSSELETIIRGRMDRKARGQTSMCTYGIHMRAVYTTKTQISHTTQPPSFVLLGHVFHSKVFLRGRFLFLLRRFVA